MDFSTQLDDLQQRAAETKTSAQAAVSESRAQLRQRIDQAKVDVDDKATQARPGPARADGTCCVWASASCSLWPGAS
jgi:hypothetical protein